MASKLAGTIGWVVVGLWVLPSAAMGDGDSSLRWSATSEMRFTDIRAPSDEDFRTGFLDKYQFSADKNNQFPFEIALSRAALDWFGAAETPRIQFRFRSPSSDLSVSGDGPSTGEFFLSQRGDLFARFPGLAADLVYRRSRIDELRLFTNPTGLGSAPFTLFNDGTSGRRRFFVRREQVGGAIHLRPCDLLCDQPKGWLSELNLRGSWEDRSGRRQLRFMLGGGDLIGGGAQTSRWRAVEQDLDQQSVKLGSSLVFSPGGLFTLELAFDHERFRNRSGPFLQSQLTAMDSNIDSASGVLGLGAGTAGLQTLGFIPETSRSTGTARFQTRLWDRRIAIHGGFQLSKLKQIGKLSPLQNLAGLDRNNIFFYSGNLAARGRITEIASVNAFVRFDNRRNRIDRSTVLFNSRDTNFNTQFDPFVAGLRNIDTGAEIVLRPVRAFRFTVGSRAHFTNRALDFLDKPLSSEGILPSVTVIDDDTVTYTVYVKSNARPISGLNLSSELGLRESPKTGYIRELDDVRYGKGRASYALPLSRPVTLSAFANGERGENNDFKMLGETAGTRDRGFDQVRYSYGVTLTGSPTDELSLFGSFFQSRDAQDFNLVRATIPRMDGRDPTVLDLDFFIDAPLEFRTDQTNLVIGGNAQLTRQASANVYYSFTRSKSRFDSINTTSATIANASRIRSDIQSIGTGLSFHLRDGADLSLGYRYDAYHDRAGVNGSAGSATPFRLSTGRHFVTLGVTLTDEFFGGKPPPAGTARAGGRRLALR
ncbi:MAG: hypothetical protein ACE5IL_01865 [Myxococcota bacterium]